MLPDDLAGKMARLYNLAIYSMEHRIELKKVCDDLFEKDKIDLRAYLELMRTIPPTKDIEKDVFDSFYLIVRKTPSDGLIMRNCPLHGWELDLVGIPKSIDSCEVDDGKKKKPKRDDGGGTN